IEKVFVRVLNKGKPLDKPLGDAGDSLKVDFADKTQAILTPKIKIGEGINVITVFDAAKSLEDSPQDSTEITCEGPNCGVAAVENISIKQPRKGDEVDNKPTVDFRALVQQNS